MNPVIDKMLTVTAEIAEQLLAVKDRGADGLPAEAKLRIIELAEMASQVPETEAMPTELQEPDTEPEEASVIEEAAQPAEVVETENVDADATPADDEQPAQGEESAREEPTLMSDEEFYFDPGAAEQAQPETARQPRTKLPPLHCLSPGQPQTSHCGGVFSQSTTCIFSDASSSTAARHSWPMLWPQSAQPKALTGCEPSLPTDTA